MGKHKTIKVSIEAELEIPVEFVSADDDVSALLVGEAVKVKSGLYENAAFGWISKATVVK